ncbi:MAG: PD-(D/E)XK nuclease family protein [Alistipes sp.]|nr:PD-(D/E)XK nuclease family protein [Alistipes sp.]
MASTFFEIVCLSDKERVQSSVIAWIFSDECKAIYLQDKLTALENLIKPTSKWNNITSMESLVEWEHMDILILLKDNNGVLTDVVVIENKIKCDLHDNQLTRYSKQLKSQNILDKNGNPKTNEINPYYNATHHYGYLTLINHNSVTDGNNIVWTNFTYKKLYAELRNGLNNGDKSDPDYHIAESYLNALDNMVSVADVAIQNPCILFLDKSYPYNNAFHSEWDYIRKYKLRHVLQVNYFESIKQNVETDINNYLAKYNGQTCTVRVSYGMQSDNAEIALDFKDGDLITKYLDFAPNGQGDFCIAVQSGSFKIAAAKDYNDKNNASSNKGLLQNRGFMRTTGNKDSIFDLYAQKQNGTWRVNNPKSNSNRARMSISRPASNPDVWFEKSNVIAEFKSCIDSLYDMLQLYDRVKQKYNWH